MEVQDVEEQRYNSKDKYSNVLLLLLITKASQVLFSGTNINNNITKSKCNLINLITINHWNNIIASHIFDCLYIYIYILF